MSNPWFVRTLVASVAILIPLSVSAQDAPEYRCVLEDLQRRVVIFYETGVIVPCEVHYFKDTEAPGEREVLWRALNESGYCEAQAQAFVEKLEGAAFGRGDRSAQAKHGERLLVRTNHGGRLIPANPVRHHHLVEAHVRIQRDGGSRAPGRAAGGSQRANRPLVRPRNGRDAPGAARQCRDRLVHHVRPTTAVDRQQHRLRACRAEPDGCGFSNPAGRPDREDRTL